MRLAPSLLLRMGLRHHGRRWGRGLLAVFGIAVGVALWVAVKATLASAGAAFDAAGTALTGAATHVVRGAAAGVPVAALAELGRMPGIAAAPVIEGRVRRGGPSGRALRFLGLDPLVDGEVRPWAMASADAGGGSLGLLALLREAGLFVASPTLCAELGLPGDGRTTVWTQQGPMPARLLQPLPALGGRGLDDVALVDIATAQEWRGCHDAVDRIDLVLPAGRNAASVQAALAASFPGVLVQQRVERESFAALTAAFERSLEALGLLSLLVAAFLVHATIRSAVAQRQIEFALLRAMGAATSRIAAALATEAVLLGLLGGVLGCVLGFGLAQGLVEPLVASLNDHFATVAAPAVALEGGLVLMALALGAATALLAALSPLLEAAQTPPRAVFVLGRVPMAARRTPAWLAPALFLLALGLFRLGPQHVALAHAGMGILLLSVALAAPRLLTVGLSWLARVGARLGPWVSYLLRSAAAGRGQFGPAISALALAVAITTGIGAMVHSFRQTVADWLDEAVPADVYVATPGSAEERERASLSAAVCAQLRALPGTAGVSAYRHVRVQARCGGGTFAEERATLMAPSPHALARLPLLEGGDRARALFAAGQGVIATEPLASRLSLAPGDEIEVWTERGVVKAPLVGIERHYRTPRGELALPAQWFAGLLPESLGFEAGPEESPEDLAARVRAVVMDHGLDLAVSTRGAIRSSTLDVFDRTFAVTAALRILCLCVAVLGIWSSLPALQLDRQGEISLLRALGAAPRNIALLVLGQTTLLGLGAGLLALPVGALLGYVLATVVNRGSFGWTLPSYEAPASLLAEGLLLATAAAFLAGVFPALKLSRMRPAAGLREL